MNGAATLLYVLSAFLVIGATTLVRASVRREWVDRWIDRDGDADASSEEEAVRKAAITASFEAISPVDAGRQ